MKILTVLQPWASLIVRGEKQMETRTWKTAHRGPLLIHAGLRFPESVRNLCRLEPVRTLLRHHGMSDPRELPLGMIVGSVHVDDCLPVADANPSEQEFQLGDFVRANYVWRLSDAKRLETPIPWQGGLGIREGPDLSVTSCA